ncbi:class I SAM-dependent methyltransferase [Hugenholtzia roseola]|uniref:class I SAM-dependent methyltransferase n=1 Tax=Hugenholtzia roseola TaxID=1002 RepID=UPI00040FFB06|nr:class I SAM-dependent methyltransferase [Hugenholtzia roseola]
MQEHQHCLLCGSDALKAKKGYERHHLVKCNQCGFVFIRKIPTLEELTRFYSGYGSEHFLSPITIKRYHQLLDQFEKYRKTNRILDVGCGVGHLLSVAKERGWEVYGVEFGQAACEVARKKGIEMQEGRLDAKLYPAESFDVITSIEVIEHINYPREEVAQIHTLLRKGGLFYCTTPNFNSLMRHYLKADFNVINYPEHLGYFTPKTLSQLLEKEGFSTKKVLTTGISFTRLQTSKAAQKKAQPKPTTPQKSVAPNTADAPKKYKDALNPESADEKLRQKIEGNPLLGFAKEVADELLNLTRTGHAMKGYFEKK